MDLRALANGPIELVPLVGCLGGPLHIYKTALPISYFFFLHEVGALGLKLTTPDFQKKTSWSADWGKKTAKIHGF